MYWNLIGKTPTFIPIVANLTHYGAQADISGFRVGKLVEIDIFLDIKNVEFYTFYFNMFKFRTNTKLCRFNRTNKQTLHKIR